MTKKGSIFENILLMWAINFFKLATPLILIPWLSRALDSESFGFYMYTVAFAAWLCILIDYGFGFSGTRSIAKNSKDHECICEILNDLISAKIVISILAIFICIVFYFISPLFNNNFLWLMVGYIVGVLTSFVPLYYFQGMESLRRLGLIEASINLLNVIMVVLLVQDIQDIKYLFALMIIPRLLIVLCSYLVIIDEINFNLKIDFFRGVKSLSDGFYFALFQISNGIYTSFNIIFLGFFVSPTLVGIYAICERLLKVCITFIGQAAHIVFPRVVSLGNDNIDRLNDIRKYSFYGFFFLGSFFALIIFLSADILGTLFLPSNKLQLATTIRLMSFALVPISLATVYYYQHFLLNSYEKYLSLIMIFGMLLNFMVGYFMIKNYGINGMAITWPIVESVTLFICIITISNFLRKNLNYI